jgi:hypothetical protein
MAGAADAFQEAEDVEAAKAAPIPTPASGFPPDDYNGSKFWLEFCVMSDGLEVGKAEAMRTHNTFPQFGDLPPEIRQKIWGYLVQPRVIVTCCFERDSRLSERRKELASRRRASPVPVVLQVNRESRDIGLTHYELAFSWKITKLLSDTPTQRPARVWFNFNMDALYLTGELEAYDSYSFNLPMVYFLQREDTHRVRHVACAFRVLHYPEQESDQIFGCLWHIVDRFHSASRLLLVVTPEDEEIDEGSFMRGSRLLSVDNVLQKIWNGWISGTSVTSSLLANKQMLLVREDGLAGFIASH